MRFALTASNERFRTFGLDGGGHLEDIYLHSGWSCRWMLLTCNQCLSVVSLCLRQGRVSPTLRITSTPASIRFCTSATRFRWGVLGSLSYNRRSVTDRSAEGVVHSRTIRTVPRWSV